MGGQVVEQLLLPNAKFVAQGLVADLNGGDSVATMEAKRCFEAIVVTLVNPKRVQLKEKYGDELQGKEDEIFADFTTQFGVDVARALFGKLSLSVPEIADSEMEP